MVLHWLCLGYYYRNSKCIVCVSNVMNKHKYYFCPRNYKYTQIANYGITLGMRNVLTSVRSKQSWGVDKDSVFMQSPSAKQKDKRKWKMETITHSTFIACLLYFLTTARYFQCYIVCLLVAWLEL